MSQYFQEHPYDKAVIDYYNKYNAQIDKLRALANTVRRDQSKTIKERQDEVRILIDNQNKMKSAFVQSVAAYGIEPD
jgi:ADP-heptose:LPS heptosyltransferase